MLLKYPDVRDAFKRKYLNFVREFPTIKINLIKDPSIKIFNPVMR